MECIFSFVIFLHVAHTQLVTCCNELQYCTCWPLYAVSCVFCEWPSLVPYLSDVGDEVWGEAGGEVVEGREGGRPGLGTVSL